MKKIILFSLLLIFSCSGEEANKVESDLEKEFLLGNIKSIEFFEYDVFEEFGKVKADTNKLESSYIVHYNESGFITSKIDKKYYHKDVYYESYKKHIFKYDSDNRLTEEEVFNKFEYNYVEDEFKLSVEYNYNYDEFGRLKSRYSNNPSNHKTLKSYSYNEDGKLKEVKFNFMKLVFGEAELGELIELQKYKYKENEEIFEVYNGDGSLNVSTVIYFKNGLKKEEHIYRNNNEEVDAIKFFKDGYIQDKIVYYYMGNSFLEFKYEFLDYDEEGNFTKKITYSKGADEQTFKPESISLWKIEYY